MMREPSYAIDVIKTISEAIDMPFSIKVRAGLTLDQKQEWFDALVQAIPYCHCISIHARTFKQGHTGENDRGYIARFQQIAGDKCKVIGNGGIRTYQDAIDIQHRLQKDHGLTLDGIMIGQAAIGNPWVFVDHTPTPAQQHQLILDHMHLTLAWHVLYEQMVTTHPELHKDAPTGDLIDTNKQYLRAFKNYDPNSDEQYEFPDLQRHDYTFPQTKYTQLMEIKTQIANDPPSHIDPQTDYHCLVEFRKYLFNYIKGID